MTKWKKVPKCKFQKKNTLTKDYYYNVATVKNDGEQGFGTTFTKEKHALLIHFRCLPTKKATKMENKGHLVQNSPRLRQTGKNQSGQFSRSVAASHWFSIQQFASLIDSHPGCVCQEAEFALLRQYSSSNLVISITRLTFHHKLKETRARSRLSSSPK